MKQFITILSLTLTFHVCTLVYSSTSTNNNEHTNSIERASSAIPLDKAMAGDIDGLVQLLIAENNFFQQKINEASYKKTLIVVAKKALLLKSEYNNLLQTGYCAGFDRVYVLGNSTISTPYYLFIYTEEAGAEFPIVLTSTLETDEDTNYANNISPLTGIIKAHTLKESVFKLLKDAKEQDAKEKQEPKISRCRTIVIFLPTSFSDNNYLDILLEQEAGMNGFKKVRIVKDSDNVIQKPACICAEEKEDGEVGSLYYLSFG